MCVVLLKSGRAKRSSVGSGVCISMNVMLGRRRTIWEEGYLGSSSRSRYLSVLVSGSPRWWRELNGAYSSQKAIVLSVNQSFFSVSMSSFVTATT